LAGCSGKTDGATDITSDSATLRGTGHCDAGQVCTWYWEYWPASSPRVLSEKTPVRGPFHGASPDVSLSTVVTNLQSNTTYRWVFCGSPNNGANYVCVGPHGQAGNTRADPPPDFATFTTGPPLRALAEGWDGTSWALRPSPNPTGAADSDLSGISCTSATACTSVGNYINGAGARVTLAERWNGTDWTIQPAPNPTGAAASHLSGISCTSPTACTAVGYYVDGNEVQATLAERWNGTSWAIQPTPNVTGGPSALNGVSCTSATACTAVGNYTNEDGIHVALAERWNGSTWTVQFTPSPTGSPFNHSDLDGVSCTSATACTAVGSYINEDGTRVTLAERWNGAGWAIQPTPNPTGAQYPWLNRSLKGISCTSATACTAVGNYTTTGGAQVTLAERWNGNSWAIQTTPVPTDAYQQSYLEEISCASATACTAVGYYVNGSLARETLADGWNGATWTLQPTPHTAWKSFRRGLEGIACTSATTCTAVGHD
jgi:hypothetical protein